MVHTSQVSTNLPVRSAIRLSVFVLLVISLASGVTAQNTKTLVTGGCSIRGGNDYYCPKNGRTDSRGNDPRAERYYTRRMYMSTKDFRYYFSAKYQVVSAKDTTIAQILNTDPKLSGASRHKPVMFLIVKSISGSRMKLCMFQSCKHVWSNVPKTFRLRVWASGQQARIKINNRKTVTFNLRRPLSGARRNNGYSQFRFGNYHHDINRGSKRARSTARVRVTNIQTRGF